MDHEGQSMLTKDLKASLIGLPTHNNVFVGWNPNSNTDVGWLTLKKGVTLDFKHLQLRDYNYNNLENVSEKWSEKEQFVDKISYDSADLKLISVVLNPEVQKADLSTPVEKVTSPVKKVVQKFEENDSENENVFPRLGSSNTICIYCRRTVKHIEIHEAKCPSKNAKNTERIKCPLCSYFVRIKGLTKHMKIHTYETINCSHCGITVKHEGYSSHLLRCKRNRKHPSILCQACNRSFSSRNSLNKHIKAFHPNMPASSPGPVVKLKYTESAKQDRIIEKLDEFKNEGTMISEVVARGEGQKAISKDISFVELSEHGEFLECDISVEDTEGVKVGDDILPAWDEDGKARCRLKFQMEVAGRVNKKTIKPLMSNSVQKSMKKFTKHVGQNFVDLEFKSNDIVLSGEELAGSIDKGLIKVSLVSFDNKERNDLEVLKDLPSTCNFEDLRRDCYEEMRSDWFKRPPLFHHSTSAQDPGPNIQEVNEDFPGLDSVSSVGFLEGSTVAEDLMEIDCKVAGHVEHVVGFSMF